MRCAFTCPSPPFEYASIRPGLSFFQGPGREQVSKRLAIYPEGPAVHVYPLNLAQLVPHVDGSQGHTEKHRGFPWPEERLLVQSPILHRLLLHDALPNQWRFPHGTARMDHPPHGWWAGRRVAAGRRYTILFLPLFPSDRPFQRKHYLVLGACGHHSLSTAGVFFTVL